VGVEFVVVGGSLRWPIMQFGNSGVDQEYVKLRMRAAQTLPQRDDGLPISTPELAFRYLFQSLFRIPCRIRGEKNKPLPTAKLVGFCCSCSLGPQPTSI
jgi:hypothetical protein